MADGHHKILWDALSRGVNPKNPSFSSTWPTPPKDTHTRPHLTPTPSKRLKNMQKGLKYPKKSQNSSHRGYNLQKGAKTPQRRLKPPKELNIERKGLKYKKGAKSPTRGLKP